MCDGYCTFSLKDTDELRGLHLVVYQIDARWMLKPLIEQTADIVQERFTFY